MGKGVLRGPPPHTFFETRSLRVRLQASLELFVFLSQVFWAATAVLELVLKTWLAFNCFLKLQYRPVKQPGCVPDFPRLAELLTLRGENTSSSSLGRGRVCTSVVDRLNIRLLLRAVLALHLAGLRLAHVSASQSTQSLG